MTVSIGGIGESTATASGKEALLRETLLKSAMEKKTGGMAIRLMNMAGEAVPAMIVLLRNGPAASTGIFAARRGIFSIREADKGSSRVFL